MDGSSLILLIILLQILPLTGGPGYENPNAVSEDFTQLWLLEPYLTVAGTIGNVSQGVVVFFLMRFAEKVATDPTYEAKIFKKHKRKHVN